jgi:hypothetical protein
MEIFGFVFVILDQNNTKIKNKQEILINFHKFKPKDAKPAAFSITDTFFEWPLLRLCSCGLCCRTTSGRSQEARFNGTSKN